MTSGPCTSEPSKPCTSVRLPFEAFQHFGGAIKKVESFLRGDTFVVLNADTVINCNLTEAISWHRQHAALATMVLRPDPHAARFGIIEIDQTSRVRRFLGKPIRVDASLTPLMFAGVHVFEPEVFSYMPAERFGINATTYPAMLTADCALLGYVFHGYWRVVDTHAGLAEARWELARREILAPSHRP